MTMKLCILLLGVVVQALHRRALRGSQYTRSVVVDQQSIAALLMSNQQAIISNQNTLMSLLHSSNSRSLMLSLRVQTPPPVPAPVHYTPARTHPLPNEMAMPWTPEAVSRNGIFRVATVPVDTTLCFKVFIMFNPNAGLADDLDAMFAIWSSWARKDRIDVHLAISPETSADWKSKGVAPPTTVTTIVVPEPNAYPPVKFEIAMWKKINAEYNDPSTVYIKLDMDTYFNPTALLQSAHNIATSTASYFGKIGYGRNSKYRSKPYCMGFAYMIKHDILNRFHNPAPLPSDVVNSDVAVGTVAGVPCQSIIGLGLHHSYFSVVNSALAPRLMQGEGFGASKQTFVPAYSHPPTPILASTAVHPIKTSAEFRRYHNQVVANLRPALPVSKHIHADAQWHPTAVEYSNTKTQYVKQSSKSCVANVADQITRYNEPLPPCYYGNSTAADTFPLPKVVVVPTFHEGDVTARLTPTLQSIGVELQLVQASRGPEQQPTVVAHALQNTESEKKVLSAGEMGYRASQKRIMIKFLEENKRSNIISNSNSNADILFIADDDVMFHRRFTSLYTNLDAYCFDGLASGGVLKLESSIWHAGTFPKLTGRYVGGWNLIDYEMRQTRSQCYSGHYANVGSVATIYSVRSIEHILSWLDDVQYNHLPFDHVYHHLAKMGVPIRTAEPNLAIAKLDKASEVNTGRPSERHLAEGSSVDYDAMSLGSHPAYATHRWNVANYHA